MAHRHNVWSRQVDCGVQQQANRIDHGVAVHDQALMIHLDQI